MIASAALQHPTKNGTPSPAIPLAFCTLTMLKSTARAYSSWSASVIWRLFGTDKGVLSASRNH